MSYGHIGFSSRLSKTATDGEHHATFLFSRFLNKNRYSYSREDETRNGQRNANRNPEWWGDFGQLKFQIKTKSQFEFLLRDIEEFKFNQNMSIRVCAARYRGI